MKRKTEKHRRQLGLRQGMLGIILLCWVLPVVLIVTLGGVYILDSMTRQYRSDMMRSAQSAAAITGRNLDSMIAASRKASYIATMGNAWASYTKTGDYVTFYNEMQTFLTQQYRYDDKFRARGIEPAPLHMPTDRAETFQFYAYLFLLSVRKTDEAVKID